MEQATQPCVPDRTQQLAERLTAALLIAAAAYLVVWWLSPLNLGPLHIPAVEGNFALVLFVATATCGAYWVAERLWFLPQRRRAAAAIEAAAERRRAELAAQGIAQVDIDVTEAKARALAQPWWLDWTAGMFPVIAIVFLLRSFVVEPFKIPSESMLPTLLVGDLIAVNKYTYGLRLPVLHTRITSGRAVQRGDVVVFRYPPRPSLDYIKRVVALPGDEVAYLNKQLTINGQPVVRSELPEFFHAARMQHERQYEERLQGRAWRVLYDDRAPGFVAGVQDFPGRDQCRYSAEGVVCRVPQGHYFVMGDNRDNSLDSRFWGFVPERNIVGRAFFVWMNFADPGRIGSFE